MNEKELLLLRLVELMFEKQQTFLLLDELYEDEIIGAYIRNIQIDSRYQQLLFEGVISQFLQSEELVVNITVENYFHHLLAIVLQKDQRFVTPESMIQLVKTNNLEGLEEGISNLLSFDVELGDFNRITELIDLSEGDEDILGICVVPLVNALMLHGVEKLAKVLLEKPTMNDWLVMFEIDSKLNELELHILRKDFLKEVIPHNQFQTKEEVLLGLKSLNLFDKEESLAYFKKINLSADFIKEDYDLLFDLGTCKYKFGDYDKALEYYESALAKYFKTKDERLDFVSKTYNNLGIIWDSKGNFAKALKYYQKCLVIDFKLIGEYNLSVATTYNNIGLVWRTKANFEKSLEYFEKSLEIYLKTIGENHSSVSLTYDNIGGIWYNKGNLDKALEYYEKSLAISIKIIGDNNSSIAITFGNIGQLFRSKGNYDKSIEYHKKCLAIFLKTLGDKHSLVAETYTNIGLVWDSKGNYDKSLKNYEKSLEIYLESIGENHPSVATTYNYIGGIWYIKGYHDKALEFCKKSLSIYLKTIGEKHSLVAKSYNNIGSIFNSKGKYDKAIKYYEKSLEIKLEILGSEHQSIALDYQSIGEILKKYKNYEKAIVIFQKGYEIQKAGGFPFNIAQCYEALNNKEIALYYYFQSAEIRKERIGIEAESTQESISNAIRLTKELSKENELPNWIKNLN
jgi:tetratricopeptide (TPR) repeat protein